jgi:hypothetical protein
MHRSGSSLAARVLNLIGVDLGNESRLLSGLADNPTGHWEQLELVHLSERVLARFGGSWDDPPLFPPAFEDAPRLREIRQEAADVVKRELSGSRVTGWKDPRCSVLLPFWYAVAPISHTVLVVRDPRYVAGSLLTRNAFNSERSAYLWLRYTSCAWRDDPDRVVLPYDELCRDIVATASRLSNQLGLKAPDEASVSSLATALRPELRHDRSGSTGPIMSRALDMYELLIRHDEQGVAEMIDDLDRRWRRAAASDARRRKVRTSLRPLAHHGVRRRVRTRVGALTGSALVRATTNG